ncbi:MAG: YbaB/EbfC family nucleoid-associated protein [Bacilli bacterium]
MNMQALMKQAQAMQRDITKIKNEIDSSVFEGKSSLVSVQVRGTKEIVKVNIDEGAKDLVVEDLSMLEDMIVLALNDAFSKVDKVTEEKMGKYSSMMPGLM